MSSPQIMEGALPSSSAKKVHQNEHQKEAVVHEEVMEEDEDPLDEEIDFDLVNLDQQDDHEASKLIFKEKDAQIRELQTNLDRAQFVISFLEQENK